jgi:hypothetical protein
VDEGDDVVAEEGVADSGPAQTLRLRAVKRETYL